MKQGGAREPFSHISNLIWHMDDKMYFFLSNWHRNIATTDLVVLLEYTKTKEEAKEEVFQCTTSWMEIPLD